MSVVMDKVREHYKAAEKYVGEERVWVTMLYGSQNYGLDTPESDVDTKTMILPSFEDVVLGKKMVSKELKMPDGSLSAVKDYRDMFKNYLKGNINFVETLYTPYYIINPKYEDAFKRLQSMSYEIANCQPVKLMHMAAAMAKQKYVAMEKPFESKKEILAKYGYDPKQLHHLVRLQIFMEDYLKCRDFSRVLVPSERFHSYLLSLKTHPMPLKEARILANNTMAQVDVFLLSAEKNFMDDGEVKARVEGKLNELTVDIFKQYLI